MSVLTFDVALATKLKKAMARFGWEEEDINRLAESDKLGGIREVVRGHAFVRFVRYFIDCDAEPYLPDGWSVEEHQKGGSVQWDASKVGLWLANDQKNGKSLEGNKLREELAKKPVFNANVLDYLLDNPYLIPEEWKGKYVYFWGTVYRRDNDRLYVRCLYWFNEWGWSCNTLDPDWNDKLPAAVRVS